MKLQRRFWFAKILTLALGLVAVIPATGYAETARGKFTLSSETHWGTAVLPAGDYEFSIESSLSPARVMVRRSSGEPVAIVIAMWTSEADSSDSSLHLETRGQDVFVSSMNLSFQDTALHFRVPQVKEVLTQTAKERVSAVPGSAQ